MMSDEIPLCEDFPIESETGMTGRWSVVNDEGERADITGRFLGSGSSRKPRHMNHPGSDYAARGGKCQACRWLELMIFQELEQPDRPRRYLVVKIGASAVPGETERYTTTWAFSPDEVVVAVSTRQPGAQLVMSRPAQFALARAAGLDPEIRAAYRAAA